jgi:hypothetical protein
VSTSRSIIITLRGSLPVLQLDRARPRRLERGPERDAAQHRGVGRVVHADDRDADRQVVGGQVAARPCQNARLAASRRAGDHGARASGDRVEQRALDRFAAGQIVERHVLEAEVGELRLAERASHADVSQHAHPPYRR